MPRVACTSWLAEVGPGEPIAVQGGDLREVLKQLSAHYPRLRSYLLDDQDRVRKHVAVFIDGEMCAREDALSRPLAPTAEIYFMQALSGG